MNKNQKLLTNIKNKYKFIFLDSYLAKQISNHFENDGCFIIFLIALLHNRIGEKRTYSLININKDDWINLFLNLYKDETIIDLFKQLKLNPVIPFEKIIDCFSCFNSFINKLFLLLKQNDINLNINENELKNLIVSAYGYILYCCIECKIPYHLKDIILDPEYDAKYLFILNYTKLFARAKQFIVDNCKDKINDLIVILLICNKNLE